MSGAGGRIVPAALALRDFGVSMPGLLAEEGDESVDADRQALPAAALEQAREEGRRQALQEAQAAFAEERERLRQAHEEELRRCEECWQREAGERLAAALDDGLRALEEALGERLAMLLTPLLERAARERALAGLRDALQALQGRDGALDIRLCGPPALLEAFRQQLGGEVPGVALEADDAAAELVARVDDTVVETRLRAWLAEALGTADDEEAAR